MKSRDWLLICGMLLALSGIAPKLMAADCTPLISAKQAAVIEYVRKHYKISDDQSIRLSQDQIVEKSCFHSLTFEGKSVLKTWELTLFLSPDQRFLFEGMLDTTIDPVEQERRKAAELMASIAQNKGASKGNAEAPVTIVEFSDFQCPFCSRFAQILEEALHTEKDSVRVVFHHLPLSMHPWARAAAEGAACAQMQNNDAFWSIHDQIFRQQKEITADNIKAKLKEFAMRSSTLDMKRFDECIENQMSLGLVFRDIDLASAHQINATPTVFVNGERVNGVNDAGELRNMIDKALGRKSMALSSNK